MKIKDKHCVCKKWKEEYLKALREGSWSKKEVMVAQKRGIRCPFCDKKLVEMERDIWVYVQFPAVFVDKPECNSPYQSSAYLNYWIPIKEFNRMLKELK